MQLICPCTYKPCLPASYQSNGPYDAYYADGVRPSSWDGPCRTNHSWTLRFHIPFRGGRELPTWDDGTDTRTGHNSTQADREERVHISKQAHGMVREGSNPVFHNLLPSTRRYHNRFYVNYCLLTLYAILRKLVSISG